MNGNQHDSVLKVALNPQEVVKPLSQWQTHACQRPDVPQPKQHKYAGARHP